MLLNLRTRESTRRIFGLGAALFVVVVLFGASGEGGFQTATPAEAVESTTTWAYPTSGGIAVGAGPSEATVLFLAPACTNCYITRIVPNLVYEGDPDPTNHPNGTTANFNNSSLHGAWLHHMVIVNSCNTTQQVFASGNERSVWQAPAGYGIFQQPGCTWHFNYHIHNNSAATRNVAVKLTVTYRTGETLTPLTPVNLDTAIAGNMGEFTIPEGYSDTHTGSGASGINNDFTMTVQGAIVTMGGHVHDYGISVAAYNNRLGDYICTSVAGYGTGSRYLPTGGQGTPGHPAAANAQTINQAFHEAGGSPDNRYHIQSMSGCAPTGSSAILCVGDVIRLHSQYNNTSSFPIFDAMGIMGITVDTSLPDSNTNGTIDACEDNDGDGDVNSADNCPDWSNPSQQMPPWSVPANDPDCDGFTTAIETNPNIATDPYDGCAESTTPSDEQSDTRWPADFNDNRVINTLDLTGYATRLNTIPVTALDKRHDLNQSGVTNTLDLIPYASMLGKICTP